MVILFRPKDPGLMILKVVGSCCRQVEEEINSSHFWVQNTLSGLFYCLFIKSRFIHNHKSREDYSIFT